LDEPDHESEEDVYKAAELELLSTLEAVKVDMNMRQLPAETVATARKPSASAAAASSLPVFDASSIKVASSIASGAAFGWDSANGDEGDDWRASDSTTLNSKKRILLLSGEGFQLYIMQKRT